MENEKIITDYIVLVGSVRGISSTVNRYIEDGWELQGGVSSAKYDGESTLYQAMIKTKKREFPEIKIKNIAKIMTK